MIPADAFVKQLGEVKDPNQYTGKLVLDLHQGTIKRVDVPQEPKRVFVLKESKA